MFKTKLPVHREAQNKKLEDSGIVWCPEIEGAKPCVEMVGPQFTQTPKCPGCFAASLGRIRRSRWSNHQATSRRGLIRLGTWREILPADYDAFCLGRGTRDDGSHWIRPDFPNRAHFVITRGLQPWSLYEAMQKNFRCLTIQVSVDILVTPEGVQQYPGDDRLSQFLALDKSLFRLKTLAAPGMDRGTTFQPNVDHFQALIQRLGIPSMRILETPLRLGGNRQYSTATPLEDAGWDPKSFLRCNSVCGDCPGRDGEGENRVLVCGANARLIQILQEQGNITPRRIQPSPRKDIAWTAVTIRAWLELGGTAQLQDLYAAALRLEPALAQRAHHQAKIRAVVQKYGVREGRGRWRYTGTRTVSMTVDAVAVET